MNRTPSATTACVILLLAAALTMPALAQQRPDPNSPRYKGVVALEGFLASEGEEAVQTFLEERIATDLRERVGDETLLGVLTQLREQFGGLSPRGARPTGPLGAALMFDTDAGQRQIEFTLSEDDPSRFASINTSAGGSDL